MRSWLLLDMHFLAYRAMFSTGELMHDDLATGVLYGVMRDLQTFQELFNTRDVCFCFDSRESLRVAAVPTYKQNRRDEEAKLDDEARERKAAMRDQILRLRKIYLPCLGYSNVFQARGYEADDIIASLCKTLPRQDERIIVGSDNDLWQLLNHRTICYNPAKPATTTATSFRAEWGLDPDQWADVKAIAGCVSDFVIGLDGVGPVTAAAYLRGGELKATGKKYQAIASPTGQRVWHSNLRLTRLPYEGTPIFDTAPDTFTEAKWAALCEKLGFKSLRELTHGQKGFGLNERGSYSRG
jgi:5'-3' exonuclease